VTRHAGEGALSTLLKQNYNLQRRMCPQLAQLGRQPAGPVTGVNPPRSANSRVGDGATSRGGRF
jgi:hypothetical protein